MERRRGDTNELTGCYPSCSVWKTDSIMHSLLDTYRVLIILSNVLVLHISRKYRGY